MYHNIFFCSLGGKLFQVKLEDYTYVYIYIYIYKLIDRKYKQVIFQHKLLMFIDSHQLIASRITKKRWPYKVVIMWYFAFLMDWVQST